LVAPVSSSGPKGEGFTNVLQSACANAMLELPSIAIADNIAAATSATSFMLPSLDQSFCVQLTTLRTRF
jgi:hypothetical protein